MLVRILLTCFSDGVLILLAYWESNDWLMPMRSASADELITL